MNIVKHLKNLNSQQSPKKPYRFWINSGLVITLLLGILIGTYLDLYYVGKGLYSFPKRPFPEIFPVHVGFTLVGLPLMLCVSLLISQRLNVFGKSIFIIFISSAVVVLEKLSERLGWFVHDPSWKHVNSLFGYTIYFSLLLVVYHFVSTKKT
ncbi:CBO0543 family protein [Bacillus nitroreducens]